MKLPQWMKRWFCRHVALDLVAFGPATISTTGEVAMTIEITCWCGYLNHRPIDVTAALREGVTR